MRDQYFCSKVLCKLNGPKPNNKIWKITQKGKTVVNCAFLRSQNQIWRNLWKILRDRTVARSHLLETLLPPSLPSSVTSQHIFPVMTDFGRHGCTFLRNQLSQVAELVRRFRECPDQSRPAIFTAQSSWSHTGRQPLRLHTALEFMVAP